jgi:hypothetical protein
MVAGLFMTATAQIGCRELDQRELLADWLLLSAASSGGG